MAVSGANSLPCDLDTIADLQKLAAILAARGYGDAAIAAVLHGNWVDLLRRAWLD